MRTISRTGIGFDEGAEPIFPDDYETNGFEVATLQDGATVHASVSFGGDVQDDQQSGDGGVATVTKTFKLTVNGDVPKATGFAVTYGRCVEDIAIFCGEIETRGDSGRECAGDGAVYVAEVEYRRLFEDQGEVFHSSTETVDVDITNSAYDTFGDGAMMRRTIRRRRRLWRCQTLALARLHRALRSPEVTRPPS